VKRGTRVLSLGLLLAVLAGAHFAYWYWPRERAEAPDPAGAAFRLLSAGEYDVCLWVPYPHQNLGALAAGIGDFPRVLGAIARLAGSSTPEEMRTFGPFLVPPARELVACSDLAGGRLRIAARVYPGLALIAKLAGRLADNAWLAGGEVGRLNVEWREGLWIVSGEAKAAAGRGAAKLGEGQQPAAADGAAPRMLPAGLAVLHLARTLPDLPAGTFLLRRAGADLDLDLVAPDPMGGGAGTAVTEQAALPDLGPGPRPALLVATRPAGAGGAAGQAPAALALFAGAAAAWSGGASRDLRAELPGIALYHPVGAPARWGMPGGALGRLLNDSLPRQDAAGWSLLALDEASLRQAVSLAPRLAALMPPDATTAPPPGALTLGLWLEPRPALDVVSRMRRFLDSFPFAPLQQVRRWHDWETVLQPLASCRRAALAASAAAPPAFHLRLESCGGRD
jgi:hypothetical protein